MNKFLNYIFFISKSEVFSFTKLLFLVCLFLNANNSLAQKGAFYENIFKKEFSELNKEFSSLKKEPPIDNNTEYRMHAPPEILPEWFLNPPVSEQNVIFSIGISDPWIDTVKGRLQAMDRAYNIAFLMSNLRTKGVIETYYNNQENKYQQISQFFTVLQLILKSELTDSFITKYNEQIYLFKLALSKIVGANKTTIEYFISLDNKEERYNQLEKLRLISSMNNIKTEYESIEINGNQQIKSIINIDTIQVLPAAYRYCMRDSLKQDNETTEICLLTGGLWQGYLKSLIHKLDITASDISPKMKSLSDNKETEDLKNSLKNLIRTIYDVSFSFSITKVSIGNKEIDLQLKSFNDLN